MTVADLTDLTYEEFLRITDEARKAYNQGAAQAFRDYNSHAQTAEVDWDLWSKCQAEVQRLRAEYLKFEKETLRRVPLHLRLRRYGGSRV